MRTQENLYNSRFTKVRWFVKRFGAAELIRKPVRVLLAPVLIPCLGRRRFSFRGQELDCLYHPYNMTWATERCVEVPIARQHLASAPTSSVLEVGNVLSHYGPVQHEILDKFEKGAGIINQDILSFAPSKRYRLILSISTFEHIGFDDEVGEGSREKILKAVASCRRLLSPEGRLVVTLPIGYNPELDEILATNQLPWEREEYYQRVGPRDWKPSGKAEALRRQYGKPFPYANALLVAEIGPLQSAS
jgi:hypothetical protein